MERERHIVTTTVDWQGITLSVSYETAYCGLSWNSHLQIQSISPERARLPVTKTGYLSHFCHPDDVEAYGGPTGYVLAWLEEAAKSKEWQEYQRSTQQLSLF